MDAFSLKAVEAVMQIVIRCRYSVRPGDALDPQELLYARRTVETAPSALLGAAVREIDFVVDGATVDVHGTVFC